MSCSCLSVSDISRRYKHLLGWIVVCAMLAGALAPALTRLLSQGQGGWLEICTTQGVKRVSLETPSTTQQGSPSHVEHCPFCVPNGGALAIPYAPPSGLPPIVEDRSTHAVLHLQDPVSTPIVCGPGNPRAPPCFLV